MRPLTEWAVADRRAIRGVFTDIDDTLTEGGVIMPQALAAIAELKTSGLTVIAITGRPVGWCTQIASSLAVDAIIAENGAVALIPPAAQRKIGLQPPWNIAIPLSKIYQQDETTRSDNQRRMQQIAARVMFEVPGVFVTRDSDGRETDLAFDYNENAKLSPQTVDKVLAILQRYGMHTTVSSIHIHGCFGDFNKWQGAQWLIRSLLGRELAQELDGWVFVGDSGNDQAMFQHFVHSVGVANIRHCADQLQHLPRYITPSERGDGFAEVARSILSA